MINFTRYSKINVKARRKMYKDKLQFLLLFKRENSISDSLRARKKNLLAAAVVT